MPKLSLFTASLFLFLSIDTLAWGPEGHRVVGQAAFGLLDQTARAEVLAVLDLPPGARCVGQSVAAASLPEPAEEVG